MTPLRRKRHNLELRICHGLADLINRLCEQAEALRDRDVLDRKALRAIAADVGKLADVVEAAEPRVVRGERAA
jgi:hypothetical protein